MSQDQLTSVSSSSRPISVSIRDRNQLTIRKGPCQGSGQDSSYSTTKRPEAGASRGATSSSAPCAAGGCPTSAAKEMACGARPLGGAILLRVISGRNRAVSRARTTARNTSGVLISSVTAPTRSQ